MRDGACVVQKAPGGSRGTPGVNTIPRAMSIGRRCRLCAAPGGMEGGFRRDAVSPGFRRGLLLGKGSGGRNVPWLGSGCRNVRRLGSGQFEADG